MAPDQGKGPRGTSNVLMQKLEPPSVFGGFVRSEGTEPPGTSRDFDSALVELRQVAALTDLTLPDAEAQDLLEAVPESAWPGLLDLADREGVLSILHSRAARLGITVPLPQAMFRKLLRPLQDHSDQVDVLRSFAAAAEVRGIPFILMKGLALSSFLYSNRPLRPARDLDLIFPPVRSGRSDALFQSLGAAKVSRDAFHRTEGWRIPGKGTIDAHYGLLWGAPFDSLWKRSRPAVIPDVPVRTLSHEDHLLFLCCHLAFNHRFQPKLLWMLDVKLYVEQGAIDWRRFVRLARALGYLRMAGRTLRLVERVYGFRSPPPVSYRRPWWDPVDETEALVVDQPLWTRWRTETTYAAAFDHGFRSLGFYARRGYYALRQGRSGHRKPSRERHVKVALEPSLTMGKSCTGIFRYHRTLGQGEAAARRNRGTLHEIRFPLFRLERWGGVLRKAFYLVWLNLFFPLWTRIRGMGCVHHTNYLGPMLFKTVPTVISVHDLRYQKLDPYRGFYRWAFGLALRRSCRLADAVITGSQEVRNDLVNLLRIPERKVHVIPHGVDPALSAGGDRRSSAHRGHLLMVGPLYLEKNHLTALKAFEVLRRAGYDRNLIVTGRAVDEYHGLVRFVKARGLAGAVDFAGHVTDERLAELYRGAHALIFPSCFEGFGYPLVEAMALGTPCIASDIPVLREVGGEAVVYADPEDVGAWVDRIRQLDDAAMREGMVQRGARRVREFTVEEERERTWAVYRSVAGGAGR